MKLANHLAYRSNGFAFRLAVPKDLRQVIGLGVIKKALRTHHSATAQAWALILHARYSHAFGHIRRLSMAGKVPSVEELKILLGRGQVRDFELEVGADGIRLKTDGTDADYKNAMSALSAVERIGLMSRESFVQNLKTVVAKGPTLGDAIQDYETTEGVNLKSNTWNSRKRAFASFAEALGVKTKVVDITRAKASGWSLDLVRNGMVKRTAVNYVSHVAQLFELMIRQGHITDNAVKGLLKLSSKDKKERRSQGFEWSAFEEAELKKIYDVEKFGRMRIDSVRWCAILGLYTGARVGELAQIFLRDFEKIEGTWCVKIHADSDGQGVKTEASNRLVPLHSDVIALGLMKRVDALKAMGEVRLFPNVKLDSDAGRGNSVSKGFSYYINALGLKPRRANATIGFHSLRKNVIQALQGTAMPEERRRALVGHEVTDVHTVSYMRAWTLKELSGLEDGLVWSKWLDIDGLRKHLDKIDEKKIERRKK